MLLFLGEGGWRKVKISRPNVKIFVESFLLYIGIIDVVSEKLRL